MSAASEALAGRYRILDQRVEGGAVVHRAFDPALGRDVTIHAADAATLADPERLARYVEVAQRLAGVQDPCVQRVLHFHEQGDLDEGCYLVLERLDHSVEDELARSDIDPALAIRVLERALLGLRALHQEGIVHRSLQPANLGLSADGERVCVGGAGMGAPATDGHPSALRYAAPETLENGGRVDRRSDLYALGMIGYEMLAGRPAFRRELGDIEATGSRDLRRASLVRWQCDRTRELTPLRALVPRVSPAWSELVAGLIDKNRRDRTPHAEAALRVLAEAGPAPPAGPAPGPPGAHARPDLTVEPRPVPQAFRDMRRVPHERPMWPKLASLVGAVVLLAGVLAWILTDPAGEAAGALAGDVELRPATVVGIRDAGGRAAAAAAGVVAASAGRDAPVSPPGAGAAASAGASEMVLVIGEALDFEAGSRPAEVDEALALCERHAGSCNPEWYRSERPRRARLEPFELDRYEVTQAQFRRFVAAERYRTTAEQIGFAWAWEPRLSRWVKQDGRSWRDPGSPVRADAPVSVLSQRDAAAYCRFVGKRLPSENEWELAARGSERRIFPWGDAWEPGRASLEPGGPARAGQAGATPQGIEALAGGVWEWTSTSLGEGEAILKGGSWAESNPANLRAAARRAEDPGMPHLDDGARCARDAAGL